MDNYLEFLAEKASGYFQLLYRRCPQAYTVKECETRIKTIAKYEEVVDCINSLPLEEKKVCQSRFDELRRVWD